MNGTCVGDAQVDGQLIFVYEYQCSGCTKMFRSSSPEASEPVLCHRCFTGGRKGAQRRGRKFRKVGKKE